MKEGEQGESMIRGYGDFRASDINVNEETCCSKVNWFYLGIFLLISTGVLAMLILLVFMIANFYGDSNDKVIWKPQGNKIKTSWADKIDTEKVWSEYPRPQLQREGTWLNLNGLWDYYIVPKGSIKPRKSSGKILVPFPVESSLSGVMKNLTENDELWYQRNFKISSDWKSENKILLNFGGVDWKCEVYINYKKVGEHQGGYAPFSFDITNYLFFNSEKDNNIIVKVFDPTDKGYQPRGKQVLELGNIWYTASSGIWQTVWLEEVSVHHIEKVIITPNFDSKEIKINCKVDTQIELQVNVTVYYKDKEVQKKEGIINQDIVLTLSGENQFHSWSPEEPNLYDIKITLNSLNGKTIDTVKSYTAIRKVAKKADEKGQYRIYLNDKIYFNIGVLDQGYWPDGLYTPPSEEAMVFDIKKIKEMGFNTIRKHAKVESARYYYNCDKLGVLIWQDMPSGDLGGNEHDPSKIDGGTEKERTEESKNDFYQEWKEIIEYCSFFQSIIVWVPFNEAWGQFETISVAQFTKNLDSSRLVNPASGGNYRLTEYGEIFDLHHYPNPSFYLKDENSINVVGEYGGLGYIVKDHNWKANNESWSHEICNTTSEFMTLYSDYIEQLKQIKSQGIAAAIFTQSVDVEGEVNGFITYDRSVVKYKEKEINRLNTDLFKYALEEIDEHFIEYDK